MKKISEDPTYFIYRDMIGLEAWIKHKYKTKPQDFISIGKVIDETYNLIITSTMDDSGNYTQGIKILSEGIKKNLSKIPETYEKFYS